MSKLSTMVVFGVLASIVACAAPATEETGAESGEALSAATCKPRAEAAQKKSLDKCQADNPLLDWAACMKPAVDADIAYNAKVAAARAEFETTINNATAACEARVAALSADEIVSGAQPTASDFAHAQTVADAKQVAALREKRKNKCAKDAMDVLNPLLPYDSDFMFLLRDAYQMVEQGYTLQVLKCSGFYATAYLANSTCTGRVAYEQEWATCRKDCGQASTAACSPSSYGSKNVSCGKLVNKKGVSWSWTSGAARSCDEATTCERTEVCDAYDRLLEKGHGESCLADGKTGTSVATLLIDPKSGAATSATLACRTGN